MNKLQGQQVPCHANHPSRGMSGEPELLAACYRGSMALADKHGIATLAFPSISTGIYGYPIDLAATLAVATVRAAAEQFQGIEEIIFCCFSQADLAVYEDALNR